MQNELREGVNCTEHFLSISIPGYHSFGHFAGVITVAIDLNNPFSAEGKIVGQATDIFRKCSDGHQER
jgi:hypothetical protein